MIRRAPAGLVVVALAVASLVVAASPATAADGSLAAKLHRVPVVDTLAGHGRLLAEGGVDIAEVPMGHDGALVRVSVFDASTSVVIEASGAPALHVDEGESASTTVLVPLVDGRAPLTATARVDARVEVLATFASSDEPGATWALPAAVTRADTSIGLAGDSVGTAPVDVGLVGLGGVPSEGVRAVHLTATFDVATDTSALLAGQEFPLAAGRTSVSTIVIVADDGTAPISLSTGDGQLRVDVRGWVPDAVQDSATANVVGSYVPVLGAEPTSLEIQAGAVVPFEKPELESHDFSIALVWGTADGERAFVDLDDGMPGRARGVLADDGVIGPQLVLFGDARAAARGAGAELVVLPLGGILADVPLDEEPIVEIDLDDGAELDLREAGWFRLTGSILGARDIDRVEILADGEVVGTAALAYRHAQVGWVFETAAPTSGSFELAARAVTRGGAQATASRHVGILLPDTDASIASPDATVLPEHGDDEQPLVAAVSEHDVLFALDPGVVPGAVIVSGVVPNAPSGFLRRVVAIDRTGDGWLARTEPATLVDAIVQTSVSDEIDVLAQGATIDTTGERHPGGSDIEVIDEGRAPVTLVTGDDVEVGPFDDSAEVADGSPLIAPTGGFRGGMSRTVLAGPGRADVDDGGFGVDEDVTAALSMRAAWALDSSRKRDLSSASDPRYIQMKGEIEASGGLAMSAEAHLSATLEVVLRITAGLDWGRPVVTVEDFSVLLTTVGRGKADLSAYLATQTTDEFEALLAKVYLPSLTFYVPTPAPTPVVIENTFSLFMRAEFAARIAVTVDYAIQRTETYGFQYSSANGFRDVHEGPEITQRTPLFGQYPTGAAEGTLDAVATFEPEFSMKLYGAAGPVFTGALGPRVTAEFAVSAANPPVLEARVQLYLRARLKGRVELTVPIVDHKLLNHELSSFARDFPVDEWTWIGDEIFSQTPDIERPLPPPLPADWAFARSATADPSLPDAEFLIDEARNRMVQVPIYVGSDEPMSKALSVYDETTLRGRYVAPEPFRDAALYAPDGSVILLEDNEPDARVIGLRRFDAAAGVFSDAHLSIAVPRCEVNQAHSIDIDPATGRAVIIGTYHRVLEEDGECQWESAEDEGTRIWVVDGETLTTTREFRISYTHGRFEPTRVLFAPKGADAYVLGSTRLDDGSQPTQLATVPLGVGILRGPDTLDGVGPRVNDAAIDPRDGSLVLAAEVARGEGDTRHFETNLWRIRMNEFREVAASPEQTSEPLGDGTSGYRREFSSVVFDSVGHLFALECNWSNRRFSCAPEFWLSETGEFTNLRKVTTNPLMPSDSMRGMSMGLDGALFWNEWNAIIRPGGFERHRSPLHIAYEDDVIGETASEDTKAGQECAMAHTYDGDDLCLVAASGTLYSVDVSGGQVHLVSSDGAEPILVALGGQPRWIEEFHGGIAVALGDPNSTNGADLVLVHLDDGSIARIPLEGFIMTNARAVGDELRLVVNRWEGMPDYSPILVTVELDGSASVTYTPVGFAASNQLTTPPVGGADALTLMRFLPEALAVDDARRTAFVADQFGRVARMDTSTGKVDWITAPMSGYGGGAGAGTSLHTAQIALTVAGDVVVKHGHAIFSLRGDGSVNWSRELLQAGQDYLNGDERVPMTTNRLAIVDEEILLISEPPALGAGRSGHLWRFNTGGELIASGRLPVDFANLDRHNVWYRFQENGVIAWSTPDRFGVVRVK